MLVQRDAEHADIEKERVEQLKGPEARAHELEELALIYVDRGLPYDLAKQVRGWVVADSFFCSNLVAVFFIIFANQLGEM